MQSNAIYIVVTIPTSGFLCFKKFLYLEVGPLTSQLWLFFSGCAFWLVTNELLALNMHTEGQLILSTSGILSIKFYWSKRENTGSDCPKRLVQSPKISYQLNNMF